MPRQLAPLLSGHEVSTVPQMGWAGVKNGELLRRADGQFDVLITGDRNLQHQQNLGSIGFGIVVLAAANNRVETIVGMADAILDAVATVQHGEVATVSA